MPNIPDVGITSLGQSPTLPTGAPISMPGRDGPAHRRHQDLCTIGDFNPLVNKKTLGDGRRTGWRTVNTARKQK